MMQFFTVPKFDPSTAFALLIHTTAADGFVFASVRLLSAPPLIDPSIVTRSAPFKMISPLPADRPEITRGTPLGLIVRV